MLLSTFNRVGGERVINKVKEYSPPHIDKKALIVKLVNKGRLLIVNNAMLTLVLTVFGAGIVVPRLLKGGSLRCNPLEPAIQT